MQANTVYVLYFIALKAGGVTMTTIKSARIMFSTCLKQSRHVVHVVSWIGFYPLVHLLNIQFAVVEIAFAGALIERGVISDG